MRAARVAHEITDTNAFAALEPEWWELWHRSGSATPFQSPAWLIPWWHHCHPSDLFAFDMQGGWLAWLHSTSRMGRLGGGTREFALWDAHASKLSKGSSE